MIEQHWSLAEKFIKKWFWLYLFSFIIAPMGYIIKIILSTDLSVSEVWIIYWVISLIVLISAYHDLWVTESINYFVPKFISENRYDKVKFLLSYWILIQIISWLIIASFFFFWADYLALNYFKSPEAAEIIKIFSFFFLIINFFQIITTFFMSVQNTFYTKITDSIRMWFTLLSTILLFILDYWNLITYSYAWLFGLIIGTIFSIIFFYKKYYNQYFKWISYTLDKNLFKEIVKYSLLVFLSAQAATILWQIDMQMLIYMIWTEAAWYYTNYLSIIWIPFMIIWPIFWFLFPVISELYGKGDIEKIKLIKTIFNKNFLSIGLSINILFFVFATTIAYILFGEKFIMSGVILQYSVLFLLFNYLLHINFQIMSGIWKVSYKFKIMLIWIVANVIMNYFLIKSIWVVWASLATWIWWLIIYILSELFLWKDYRVKFDLITFIKNLFIFSTLWFLSFYYILPNFDWLSRVNSLLLLLLVTFVYIFVFIITNLSEIKKFVYEIKMVKKTLK